MKNAIKAFEALSRSMPATVGVAIASEVGQPISFGEWSTGVAWSTIKVPLAVAALRAYAVDSEQVSAAIARSDNAAAEDMWSLLGGAATQLVQAVLRDGGDHATTVESRRLREGYTPFGQTRWSLTDQATFAAGLTRVPGASRVVDLMRHLSDDHRWGLAAKGYAAKGGWGPGLGDDYLVRQFAIAPGNIGIALAADVRNGGYEAGVVAVNRLADWVVDEALAED